MNEIPIKVSDLRIGNVISVYDKPQKVVEIYAKGIKTEHHKFVPINDVEPVNLSEKTIIDYGFMECAIEGESYYYYEVLYDEDDSPTFGIEAFKVDDNGLWGVNTSQSDDNDYFTAQHELQNLFFGLEQTDLVVCSIDQKKNWRVADYATSRREVHVIPNYDDKGHIETRRCRCKPSIENIQGVNIIRHNSYDGREGLEMANEILYKIWS